jgi:hypothetical protein
VRRVRRERRQQGCCCGQGRASRGCAPRHGHRSGGCTKGLLLLLLPGGSCVATLRRLLPVQVE